MRICKQMKIVQDEGSATNFATTGGSRCHSALQIAANNAVRETGSSYEHDGRFSTNHVEGISARK